jgi:hypothetical protein
VHSTTCHHQLHRRQLPSTHSVAAHLLPVIILSSCCLRRQPAVAAPAAQPTSSAAWRGSCWQVQRRLRLLCVAARPAQLWHQQCVVLVRVCAEGDQVGDVLARDVTEVLLQAGRQATSTAAARVSGSCGNAWLLGCRVLAQRSICPTLLTTMHAPSTGREQGPQALESLAWPVAVSVAIPGPIRCSAHTQPTPTLHIICKRQHARLLQIRTSRQHSTTVAGVEAGVDTLHTSTSVQYAE